LRVIQFNIAFAITVKLIFLVLAVFGYTSLWLAIAADTGATLIVTANALRLLQGRSGDASLQIRNRPGAIDPDNLI
jgi:cation transport ATPase